MSLPAFQRAAVDLTLAPSLARALRLGDAGVLDPYDLTAGERERLRDMVVQPGMSVNCSLSRGARLEVIFDAFPMSCVLARPVLRDLLDAHCEAGRPTHYQLADEPAAFAAILGERITSGLLDIPYLPEIFAYETACLELTRRARADPGGEAETVVAFRHSPDALLAPLSRLKLPPDGLPEGDHAARVRLRDGRFEWERLPADR